MRRIGIMQGRLLPPTGDTIQCFPREEWAKEFELAAAAGLDTIEWIYDGHAEDVNPISNDAGIEMMKALARDSGVCVVSLCADYFMEHPLVPRTGVPNKASIAKLDWLIRRGALAGISRFVLPFVDNSCIAGELQQSEIVAVLSELLPLARACGIELHLETSLAPNNFAILLAQLPATNLRANYDCGNSASLGYDFRQEFAAYGDHIGSVHIKDRVRGGSTVPLGKGDAELPEILQALHKLSYAGDFVLQVARGPAGGEVDLATRNREFVQSHMEPVFHDLK